MLPKYNMGMFFHFGGGEKQTLELTILSHGILKYIEKNGDGNMLTWFVNQKLSRKFILSFLIMALFAAIIGGIGVWNILTLKNETAELYESYVLGVQFAEDASRHFEYLRYNLVMLSVQESATGIYEYRSRVDVQFRNVQTSLVMYASLIKTEEGQQRYDRVLEYWNQYTPVREALFNSVNTSYGEKLDVINSYSELSDQLRVALVDIIDADILSAKEKADENASLAMRAIIVEVAILAGVIAIAILLGYYVAHVTGRPIVRAVQIAEKLAVGDIDVKSLLIERDLNRRDEVGQLSAAFDRLIDATAHQVEATERLAKGDLTQDISIRSAADILGKSLQAVINNLNEVASSIIATAGQVASGAGMISDSSLALSDGAARQASAIEELTASIEEIAEQTANNAKNAAMANQLAADTRQYALQGDTQMNAMLNAMDAINGSSAKISKIIKVIDDIAFQTNILALNAAVEAARASQHGKGFAVVAEEVRTLAARSANAAKETTEMIEDSIRNIRSGIDIAKDTADALNKIVEEITKVAELVESIAKASQEQTQGIDHINQGIMQVSQVVQSNAASAEEGAAASEELATQAQQLKDVVSVFETKSGTTSFIPELESIPVEALPMEEVQIFLDDTPDKY
jgi:methyl-accepting chemotaxis protein